MSIENITDKINRCIIDDNLLVEKAAKTIQYLYKNRQLNKIYKGIFEIYKKYKLKLFKKSNSIMTIWEQSAGYTEGSSLKNFQQYWGDFMVEIYDISPNYQNLSTDGLNGSCDGISENCLYEAKSKFNTMKGSMAYEEIKKKLEYAIQVDKDFKLLILVDKNNKSRKIPLHEGQSLKKIKDIEGYDENRHLWISQNEVFNHLFHSNSYVIEKYIQKLLKYTNPN
jgi:hypothetical protein